jgi:molybdopterin-containing oxidoreductase family iron-sulfur binding subunit
MVIDLTRCVGCGACQIACKEEHFLPPGINWNRVLLGETGRFPTVRKQIYPVLCNHCAEPACVKACPTSASTQREDGIVLIDSDKCMGCRYCLIACPYQQRTFHEDGDREYFPGQGLTPWEELGRRRKPYQTGIVLKCTFCAERIDDGLNKGLQPGVDREASPACVINCPTTARVFGDLDDPKSAVSTLIKEKKGFRLKVACETEPCVYYLP